MVATGKVLFNANFAELVMHARQQLCVMCPRQADAALVVMTHVLHLLLDTVHTIHQNIEMTLKSSYSTAELSSL